MLKQQRLIIAAQQSALRHVALPPRLLFTTARIHNVAAAAHLSSLERMDGSAAVLMNVVNPDLPAHTGRVIFDDDTFSHLFKASAYPIPEGQTYIVRHLRNGVFAIVEQNGSPPGAGVDEADGSE